MSVFTPNAEVNQSKFSPPKSVDSVFRPISLTATPNNFYWVFCEWMDGS